MIDPKVFLDFIKERRSIRAFQDKQIPEKEIEMILEAGRWAPSASNRQPWEFIVIKNRDILKKIAGATGYGFFIAEASFAIAIVGKPYISQNWYVVDTSLVSMNMMLMAWSLGIGTCWIGSMNKEKAKEILGLGRNDYLLTVLPFGYIQSPVPEPTYRNPLRNIVKEI
ncbi:MAG: nitroreductase family protein [Candidatus Lokiarchaeota archaeon]|nr:nitroreductase family protein [Candidatus Lokiarchaeota archaeon]